MLPGGVEEVEPEARRNPSLEDAELHLAASSPDQRVACTRGALATRGRSRARLDQSPAEGQKLQSFHFLAQLALDFGNQVRALAID